MRDRGKITSWNTDRGFGFITPNGGGNQVFVHIRSFANRDRMPVENEIVTYELKPDAKGRAQAVKVAFSDERLPEPTSFWRNNSLLMLPAAFLYFVSAATLSGRLPPTVLGIYLIASAISFIGYALDKSAAINGKWRTREGTLHIFALVGGWPGAIVAQRLLRHKSKKQSFQTAFWITVILNCGALGYLLTLPWTELLRLIIHPT